MVGITVSSTSSIQSCVRNINDRKDVHGNVHVSGIAVANINVYASLFYDILYYLIYYLYCAFCNQLTKFKFKQGQKVF